MSTRGLVWARSKVARTGERHGILNILFPFKYSSSIFLQTHSSYPFFILILHTHSSYRRRRRSASGRVEVSMFRGEGRGGVVLNFGKVQGADLL